MKGMPDVENYNRMNLYGGSDMNNMMGMIGCGCAPWASGKGVSKAGKFSKAGKSKPVKGMLLGDKAGKGLKGNKGKAALKIAAGETPYVGQVVSFIAEKSSGYIHCDAVHAMCSQDIYAYRDVLERGKAGPGDTVCCFLHWSNRGQPQASSPLIRLSAGDDGFALKGIYKPGNDGKGFGFIECAETKEFFGRDVYVNKEIASNLLPGHATSFNACLNQYGLPNAMSATPCDEAWEPIAGDLSCTRQIQRGAVEKGKGKGWTNAGDMGYWWPMMSMMGSPGVVDGWTGDTSASAWNSSGCHNGCDGGCSGNSWGSIAGNGGPMSEWNLRAGNYGSFANCGFNGGGGEGGNWGKGGGAFAGNGNWNGSCSCGSSWNKGGDAWNKGGGWNKGGSDCKGGGGAWQKGGGKGNGAKPTPTGRFYTGIIKSFNEVNNYGFVLCDELKNEFDNDVFCHGKHIMGHNVGETIFFELGISSKGQPQVVSVQGGDIMGGMYSMYSMDGMGGMGSMDADPPAKKQRLYDEAFAQESLENGDCMDPLAFNQFQAGVGDMGMGVDTW